MQRAKIDSSRVHVASLTFSSVPLDQDDQVYEYLGPYVFEGRQNCFGSRVILWDQLVKNAENDKVSLEIGIDVQDPNITDEVLLTNTVEIAERNKIELEFNISNWKNLMAVQSKEFNLSNTPFRILLVRRPEWFCMQLVSTAESKEVSCDFELLVKLTKRNNSTIVQHKLAPKKAQMNYQRVFNLKLIKWLDLINDSKKDEPIVINVEITANSECHTNDPFIETTLNDSKCYKCYKCKVSKNVYHCGGSKCPILCELCKGIDTCSVCDEPYVKMENVDKN